MLAQFGPLFYEPSVYVAHKKCTSVLVCLDWRLLGSVISLILSGILHSAQLKERCATFKRVVDTILSAVKWLFLSAYLVDIEIFSRTACQLFNCTRLALSLLEEPGVSLKLKKCVFLPNKTDYPRHVVHRVLHEAACRTASGKEEESHERQENNKKKCELT